MRNTQCDNYITSKDLNGEDIDFKRDFKRDFNQVSKDEGCDSVEERVAKVAKVDATSPCIGETSMKRKLTEFKLPVAKVAKVAKVDATSPCVGETSMKRKLTEFKLPVAKVAKVDGF
jgi:hypothetical protein